MASGPADAENLSHDAPPVKRGGWHLPEPIDFSPDGVRRPKGYIKDRVVHVSHTVLDDERVTATMLAVYVALASFAAYETGKAWPSLTTLASKAGCDRSTVKRQLTLLEEAGFVRRLQRRTGNRNLSTVYYVCEG